MAAHVADCSPGVRKVLKSLWEVEAVPPGVADHITLRRNGSLRVDRSGGRRGLGWAGLGRAGLGRNSDSLDNTYENLVRQLWFSQRNAKSKGYPSFLGQAI